MPVLYSLTEYKRPKAGQYRVLGQEYANGYGFERVKLFVCGIDFL